MIDWWTDWAHRSWCRVGTRLLFGEVGLQGSAQAIDDEVFRQRHNRRKPKNIAGKGEPDRLRRDEGSTDRRAFGTANLSQCRRHLIAKQFEQPFPRLLVGDRYTQEGR
jgi:hypothetical protein